MLSFHIREVYLTKNKIFGKKAIVIIKVIVFFSLAILIFVFLQRILSIKWNYPIIVNNSSYSFDGFYHQETETDEVLFLGTSHTFAAISPLELYKTQGIISYNLGTPGQPVVASYYILKEAFSHQSPSLVILDASRFFKDIDKDIK